MNERFSQPNAGVHKEIPHSHFIGVIDSLSLSPKKKETIVERIKRLKELHWSDRDIANELEIRFHIKVPEIKKSTPKSH